MKFFQQYATPAPVHSAPAIHHSHSRFLSRCFDFIYIFWSVWFGDTIGPAETGSHYIASNIGITVVRPGVCSLFIVILSFELKEHKAVHFIMIIWPQTFTFCAAIMFEWNFGYKNTRNNRRANSSERQAKQRKKKKKSVPPVMHCIQHADALSTAPRNVTKRIAVSLIIFRGKPHPRPAQYPYN